MKLSRLLGILRKQKASRIERLPVGFELSDRDQASLYGLPDKFIKEVCNEQES